MKGPSPYRTSFRARAMGEAQPIVPPLDRLRAAVLPSVHVVLVHETPGFDRSQCRALDSVLSTWQQAGFVAGVTVANGVKEAAAVCVAMDPMQPVVLVNAPATVIVNTDWRQWEAEWRQCPLPLWCTSVVPATDAGLEWHCTVNLGLPLGWCSDTGVTAAPLWGMMGGLAGALALQLPPNGDVSTKGMEGVLGALWSQPESLLHVGRAGWVWLPPVLGPTTPPEGVIQGPYRRLQRVLPQLVFQQDRVLHLARTMSRALHTPAVVGGLVVATLGVLLATAIMAWRRGK